MKRDIQLLSVVQVVNQNEKTEKNEKNKISVEVDIQEQKTCIWKLTASCLEYFFFPFPFLFLLLFFYFFLPS